VPAAVATIRREEE
jgi:hypothetical protein